MSWQYEVIVANYQVLTDSQMEENAREFYNYFANSMTLEAICGILGNIHQESVMNPGQKQGASDQTGWGLIQWTPATDLTSWCAARGYNWYDGSAQCALIADEGTRTENPVWIPTVDYPYTWVEFCGLTDLEEATEAYLSERERAGVAALQQRIAYAHRWYDYLYPIVTPFVPRLNTDGMADSIWYYSTGNPFYPDLAPPVVGGNCTWYAYGRYAEIRNSFANLPTGDAGTWYDNATDFERGQTPRLGAIACFHSASGTGGPGHVCVVEVINNDGTIVTSNSGYPSNYFWTATVSEQDGYREPWYTQQGRDYVLQGFIYNSGIIPPTPPAPTRIKKMPLWMMLKKYW